MSALIRSGSVLLGALLLLISLSIRPAPVLAHAILAHSIPEASALLTTAPRQVEMWFTEPLEPAFSGARLLDTSGNEVPTPRAQADLVDPFHMTLPLEPLSPGLYTVAWQTLSQADGHEWRGAFSFTVLNPDGTRPGGQMWGSGTESASALPAPAAISARWLLLTGSMLLFGLPLFYLLVGREEGKALASLVRRGLLGSAVAALVGNVLGLVHKAQQLGGLDTLSTLLLSARTGQLTVARLVILLVVLGGVLRAARTSSRRLVALTALSLVLLGTISLESHAAPVPGSFWAILGDLVHLVAAATWLSGLLALCSLVWRGLQHPEQRASLTRVAARFSALAAVAMLVLVLSGLWSSLIQVPSLAALVETTYGRTLLAKLAFVLLVLGVAALNRQLLKRSAEALAQPGTWQRFTGQLSAEVGLALLLLISVAVLVQTTVPARGMPDLFLEHTAGADDLRAHVQITPNRVGNNHFGVHLYPAAGAPLGEVQAVRLFFTYRGEEIGQEVAEMELEANDHFILEGTYLSRAGPWDVEVYVRRRGMDDTLLSVPIDVAPPAGRGSPWQNPLSHLPPALPVALVLALVLLPPVVWWAQRRTSERE